MSRQDTRVIDVSQDPVQAADGAQADDRHPAPDESLADPAVPGLHPAHLGSSLGGTQAPPAVQALAARAGSLARIKSHTQAVLADAAWRLRRVGSSGLVGIGLLVGAAILYTANTLPQAKSVLALKSQLAKLGPLAQGGAVQPQAQVAIGGLPAREDASDVLGRIYQEAQSAGVELPRGEYEYVAARDGVAAHYRMTFPVHAGYPQLRTFMDNTLLALPSVAVEGLRIERKNVTDETVDAELKLAAFVRDGT